MDQQRILVVEDDKLLKDLYVELLREEGFIAESAVDGQEGLDKIQAGGYDLILLDIMLPKKDGLTILEELKQSPPAVPNGPIVILTNLGQDEAIKRALNSGAAGYLIKSALTPDQVLHEVRTFLAPKS